MKIIYLISFSLIFCELFNLHVKIFINFLQFYNENDEVNLTTNNLQSYKTQIPYKYESLNYCNPIKPNYSPEGFSELLSGTRARYTNFKIKINHNQTCEISCQKNEGFNLKEVNKLKWYIDHNYTMWFYLDHLPAGMKYVLKNGNSYTFYIGVPIGIVREDEYFLNNHLTFEIELVEVEG